VKVKGLLKNRLAIWAITTAVLIAPRASEACAVCSFRDDGTQKGFMIGTLFMTLLPFAVIGSILLVVRRRLRRAAAVAAAQPARDFGSLRARNGRGAGFGGASPRSSSLKGG
jgi:hypothetical protein